MASTSLKGAESALRSHCGKSEPLAKGEPAVQSKGGTKTARYCSASIKRVIVRFKSLSDRRNSSILLMECSTVVWCLPPNCRPISGSEAVVSCLTIYIATCRGKAIARVLLRTFRSCSRRLKCSLTRFWIKSMVTRFSCDAMMFRNTCCAVPSEIVAPVSDAYAISRVSAPSSSRTLDLMARAMYSATSSGRLKRSFSAFFCRMAILVSRSGGWMSAINPHSNRERSRSSIELMSFGRQSEEMDIVDQQNVHGMEAVAETDHAVKAQRIDDFDGEFFRADIAQPHRRIALLDGVTDGVHQVRLAHAHAAVKEQRVVGFRRLLGHRARSGMREFVGLANHERIERVPQIELVVAALKIQFCLFHAADHRRRLDRLLFRTHVLHFYAWRPDFMKDGLDDVAVRAR